MIQLICLNNKKQLICVLRLVTLVALSKHTKVILTICCIICSSICAGKSNDSLTTIQKLLRTPISIDTVYFTGTLISVQSKQEWRNPTYLGGAYDVYVFDSIVDIRTPDQETIKALSLEKKDCIYKISDKTTLDNINFIFYLTGRPKVKNQKVGIDFIDDNSIYRKDRKYVYRKFWVQNVKSLRIKMSKTQLMQIVDYHFYDLEQENTPLLLLLLIE